MYGSGFSIKEVLLQFVRQFIKVNKLKTPSEDDHSEEDGFLGLKKKH